MMLKLPRLSLLLLVLLILLGVSTPLLAQEPADSGGDGDPGIGPEPTATLTPTVPALTATATATATVGPKITPTPMPLDRYEPDNLPEQAKRIVIGEEQIRTFFTPLGEDADWAVVLLKPGRWRLSARTSTDIYDPRMTVDGITVDDTGNSKDAVIELSVGDERDHLIFVENMGIDGDGRWRLLVERVGDQATATPYPTYTPLPTYTPPPPTPVIYPTYTALPTYTPYPQPSATLYPTYTPYPPHPTPVPPMPANPPGPTTGSSGGNSGSNGGYTGGSSSSGGDKLPPAGADAPAPTPVASELHLQVFVDTNRNGVMDWGEEAENVLIYGATRDGVFETSAYTVRGEARLSLTALPEDRELVLLVPYLHRAASMSQQRGQQATSDVIVDQPAFPLYLP